MEPFTFSYPLGGVLVNHITLDILWVKASLAMFATLLPMVTDLREEQPKKALSLIIFTLLPMVTDLREEQPKKAYSLIVFTLLPIVTSVRAEQPEKASISIVVTLFGIVTPTAVFTTDYYSIFYR